MTKKRPNGYLNPSVDFCIASLKWFDTNTHHLIKKHCNFKRRYRDKYGFYKWIEEYHIKSKFRDYIVFLQFPDNKKNKYAPVSLKLMQPDNRLIYFFDIMLRHIPYCVSKIELSFDFVSNSLDGMYDYLKKRVYLKWPGAQLNLNCSGTTYYNNIRKSRGKGCRLYKKRKGIPIPAARLELLLKRDPLRKYGINQLQDICLIDHEIVKKYLELYEFDFRLFRLRYMKENKDNKSCFKNYGRLEKRIIDLIDDGKLHAANSLSKQYVRYSNLKECYLNKVLLETIDAETMLH